MPDRCRLEACAPANNPCSFLSLYVHQLMLSLCLLATGDWIHPESNVRAAETDHAMQGGGRPSGEPVESSSLQQPTSLV